MQSKKKHLIIGIDFDNTIVDSKYPEILGLKLNAKEVITKWYKQGIFIQIHSCRNGKAEWELATFLFENQIPYHVINDHASFIKQEYFDPHHPISRKLYHDILIDDTSLHFKAQSRLMNWKAIDGYVQDIIEEGDWDVKPNFNCNYEKI
jgi:hypothetical protein